MAGCGYRFGVPDRVLPGGYKQVTIPMFKNRSMEPGLEVSFTNALVQEFEKSRSARVVDPMVAEVEALGEIIDVQYKASGLLDRAPLPAGSVLATTYAILLKVKVTLRRRSDSEILWTRELNGERSYAAPQVTRAGVNSVNAPYNLSARRHNIEIMASELMSEAHDGISENF